MTYSELKNIIKKSLDDTRSYHLYLNNYSNPSIEEANFYNGKEAAYQEIYDIIEEIENRKNF